ncbi:MAG: DUF4405 domain-containing protein [Thermodesulfobacteriota bacterium]
MDKGKLNFVIDALMFLCLMGIAGLGFLMKYVLLPGREARMKYGGPVELSWLGWDRHDWGQIHLYLAFFLLGLLLLHIILDWQVILGLWEKLIPNPRMRTRIAFAFLLITVLLLYVPFLVTPEAQERGRRGRGLRSEAGGYEKSLAQGTVIAGETYYCRSKQEHPEGGKAEF